MKRDQKSTYCEHCGDFHDAPPGEFASSVRVGELIPDFEFEALHKGAAKPMKLSDLRGKWAALFFYPADFSEVSSAEFAELAAAYQAFKKLGAELVTVSTDSILAHKAWRESDAALRDVSFPMGSDPSGKMCFAFGTLIEDEGAVLTAEEGLSLRATFIVDPHGVLRGQEVLDTAVGRPASELMRRLKALQYVETHPDRVALPSWGNAAGSPTGSE